MTIEIGIEKIEAVEVNPTGTMAEDIETIDTVTNGIEIATANGIEIEIGEIEIPGTTNGLHGAMARDPRKRLRTEPSLPLVSCMERAE